MAKDFAVQNYKKDKSNSKTNLIVGIITVVFVISFYIFKIRDSRHKNVTNIPGDQITEVIEKEVKQPRFKFYTMLSETQDNYSDDHAKNIEHGKFILRIAEFKYKAEAVKLQRRLESKNYAISVNTIQKNKKTYYSVIMGPYPNNVEAKQAKLDLEKDHYRSTLKKLLN